MKHIIMNAIGQLFTNLWIEGQGRPEIKEFKRSAEDCRILANTRRNTVWSGWTLWTIGILLGISMTFGWVHDEIWGRTGEIAMILSLLVPGVLCIIIPRYFPTGETSVGVSEAWKPIRRKLLKLGIVDRIKASIKNEKNLNTDWLLRDDIRVYLVKAINDEHCNLFCKCGKARVEGLPRREEFLNGRIDEVVRLASDMGLSMTFPKIVRLSHKCESRVKV